METQKKELEVGKMYYCIGKSKEGKQYGYVSVNLGYMVKKIFTIADSDLYELIDIAPSKLKSMKEGDCIPFAVLQRG